MGALVSLGEVSFRVLGPKALGSTPGASVFNGVVTWRHLVDLLWEIAFYMETTILQPLPGARKTYLGGRSSKTTLWWFLAYKFDRNRMLDANFRAKYISRKRSHTSSYYYLFRLLRCTAEVRRLQCREVWVLRQKLPYKSIYLSVCVCSFMCICMCPRDLSPPYVENINK